MGSYKDYITQSNNKGRKPPDKMAFVLVKKRVPEPKLKNDLEKVIEKVIQELDLEGLDPETRDFDEIIWHLQAKGVDVQPLVDQIQHSQMKAVLFGSSSQNGNQETL